MDTSLCFVLLLAIGLSVQRSIRSVKSEFQIDLEYLVNQVKLQDGKGTLWVSTTIHATNLTLLKTFKNHTFLNVQII